MILSGKEILRRRELGDIVISDFDESRLGPNSYNIRLGDELMVYTEPTLDMAKDNPVCSFPIPSNGMWLMPDELYLGRTYEWTETRGLVPMLEGRSSIGRLGMTIHVTAGFGDVGFCGYWTLEITVKKPLKIYPRVQIGQIYYHTIEGDASMQYRGKYYGSNEIRSSHLWEEFNHER